jgi:hypothetical protein
MTEVHENDARLWAVSMAPVQRGVVVVVTDGKINSLIGRVAWDVAGASRPLRALGSRSFKRRLQAVVARAEREVDRLNENGRRREGPAAGDAERVAAAAEMRRDHNAGNAS